MRHLTAIALLLTITGCVSYALVEPGSFKVGDAYQIQLDQKWSKIATSPYQTLMTLDGLSLQFVEISEGTEKEKSLLGIKGDKLQPPYDPAMSLLEIQNFIRDSFVAIGAERFETTSIIPDSFGEWPGFRIEFEYFTKNGLMMRGLMVGAQKDEKLYSITYVAASFYYFDKNIGDVERMIGSIKPILKT